MNEKPEKAEEWRLVDGIIDYVRQIEEIKKPSMAAIRKAIARCAAEGESLESLAEDPELVVDALMEDNPDLERDS